MTTAKSHEPCPRATQALISKSGGIPPLIAIIARANVIKAQEHAAKALWHLASTPENQLAIAEANGIEPLVVMLSADGKAAPELAAVTIVRLAKDNIEVAKSIASCNGIEPLVGLLTIGSPEAQQQSAAALAELGQVSHNRNEIAQAGAIDPLIRLLTSQTAGTPETAARALAHLARSNSESDEDAFDKDDKEAGRALFDGAYRRAQIERGGGIIKLIAMLDADEGATDCSCNGANGLASRRLGLTPANPAANPNWQKVQQMVFDSSGQLSARTADFGVQEQAAQALCNLSYLDTEMQDAIIEAGGVAKLLELVHASSQLAQENSARAIWHLCELPEHQRLIVEEGCIPELVNLMRHGSLQAQEVAAAGISQLAHGGVLDRMQREECTARHASGGSAVASVELDDDDEEFDRLYVIAEAGGILPLVALLTSGGMAAKEHAAAALHHLAKDSDNQLAIARANGITPLVALLDGGSEVVVQNVKNALSRLAEYSEDNQAQIAKRCVSMLTAENSRAQELSAFALWSLAKKQPQGAPVVVVNAGAISPLVLLLSTGTLTAKQNAAAALSTLAIKNPQNQLAIAIGLVGLLGTESHSAGDNAIFGHDTDAEEHVTKLILALSNDVDNRKAIAEAGAIERLVVQLRSPSIVVQEVAASVLNLLIRDGRKNVTQCAESGGITPLVDLLSSQSAVARAQAALVIGAMTQSGEGRRAETQSADHQAVIVQEGGIAPLVSLLTSTDADSRAAAAGALWSLARGLPESQVAVADAGAIKPLVALLQDPDSRQQLAAAGAISGLAAGNPFNQDAVTDSDAIPSLVALLSYAQNKEVQGHAANALAELSRDHAENQSAVAAAGAIIPLISLLKVIVDATPSNEMAAGALWSLSARHLPNQVAIAEAGGIQPLVDLLGTGNDQARKQAAGALASLALDNHENELTVSDFVMRLLESSVGPGAMPGLAAKAAHAISRLADEHESHQNALARASGVEKLTAMLEDGTSRRLRLARQKLVRSPCPSDSGSSHPEGDDTGDASSLPAQKEIAGALWSMAMFNANNQQAIAKAGGIPKLVALLAWDPAVHRNAAGALWSLADDTTNALLIAEHNGIKPLVDLLHIGGGHAQDAAAGALHGLAALEENRTGIAKAGGIQPLVDIFNGGSQAAVEEASGALTTLVSNNPENRREVASRLVEMLQREDLHDPLEVQECVISLIHNLCLDSDMREPIAKAGGIPELVRQLEGGDSSTQSHAAKALSQIALKSANLRVQVTKELVQLLSNMDELVRQRAGETLRDMAEEGGDESQKIVATSGGVAPLVALLKDGLLDGRLEAQEYALWSLSLANDPVSRATMAREGCIELLVQSLNTGELSKKAEEDASNVLAGLARDSDNCSNMTDANHDGIPPLVALLTGDSSIGAKKNAATALARLGAHSQETQLAIAKAGAISSLVRWLTADSPLIPGMAELAARALADIASENDETAEQIVGSGAISPLVKMLESGRGSDAHKSASGCLGTLAKANVPMEKAVCNSAPTVLPGLELDTDSPEPSETSTTSLAVVHQSTVTLITEAGGIPLLVELLKSERVGPHENASRAIWQLAHSAENQRAIARADGIIPLVGLLTSGTEATQRHSAGALERLARNCPENQLILAKAKAIGPLVVLLGCESSETQEHAVEALLYVATHVECRNAVVRRLVSVLDLRNAHAHMRATGALAELVSRSVAYRNAIYESGAIPPLVRQLGDGERVENDTPQERAACVLAGLARSTESKQDIVEAGGILPLVHMLGSASNKAQAAASIALSLLACCGENKVAIVKAGGIERLVAVLAGGNRDAKRPATAALGQLTNSSENKLEILESGGIPLLLQLMNDDPHTQESVAKILSELAKSQKAHKQAIVDAGGIQSIAVALKEGTPAAQRFAASAFWGLASVEEFKKPIVDVGAVPPLVSMLHKSGEAQGHAVAALYLLAEIGEGKKSIFSSNGVEQLVEIAKNADRAWLRGQAVEVLAHLNIMDPLTDAGQMALSPRSPRTSRTPRTPRVLTAQESCGTAAASLTHTETFVTTGKLKMRHGCERDSDEAGSLLSGTRVIVLERCELVDGTQRARIARESGSVLGWVSSLSKDGRENLEAASHTHSRVSSTPRAVGSRFSAARR